MPITDARLRKLPFAQSLFRTADVTLTAVLKLVVPPAAKRHLTELPNAKAPCTRFAGAPQPRKQESLSSGEGQKKQSVLSGEHLSKELESQQMEGQIHLLDAMKYNLDCNGSFIARLITE